MTMATGAAVAQYQYTQAQAVQRLYLPMYIKATVADRIGIATGRYSLAGPEASKKYLNQEVATWLQAAVFDGRSLHDIAMPILWWMSGIGSVALILGLRFDARRRRERRMGRWVRGTASVPAKHFTRLAVKQESYK